MISLSGSSVGLEELEAIRVCFERQWLGAGQETERFEKTMAERLGVSDFLFLNSASNGLQMAFHILDLPKYSEVIIPSYAWISCANAIILNNLTPVFCDVDYCTGNVTAEHIREKRTQKTSALLIIHYAGKPVDMDALSELGLPIVEDAAHAVDSTYKGFPCGIMGEVGIFSFDPTKNLTTGEGGGLVVKEENLMRMARRLRSCGIEKSGIDSDKERWWEYDVYGFFPKMLNTDVAAAMGLVQLKKLQDLQARRKALWEQYTRVFTTEAWAIDWIEPPPGPEAYERHSYFTYQIKLKYGSRDLLAKFLRERGIYTNLRYHPLHLNPAYGSRDRLVNCERLNATALNLPLHPRLREEEVDYVLDTLKAFL